MAAAGILVALFAAAPALAALGPAGGVVAAHDCAKSCTFQTRPVCGSDGEWYQNDCIAVCSGGVHLADAALCQGKPMPFMDARPGPPGAESAPLNATSDLVPASVLTQFLSDGFKYVGRIRLARDLGSRPEPAAAGEQPAPEKAEDGSWLVKAVRCTPAGDVYVGSMKVPSKPLKLDSYMPPWLGLARPHVANATLLDFAASLGVIPSPAALRNATARRAAKAAAAPAKAAKASGGGKEKGRFDSLLSEFYRFFQSAAAPKPAPAAAAAAAPAANGAEGNATAAAGARRRLLQARLLKELVGGDDRKDCQRGFPYTAIGQIQVVDNTGLYICTGTLIAPDKVLTAGHCVWNIKKGAFYYNLNYAPGRYREGERIVNPWGVVPWKSVTVFDSFKKNPSSWDVAVVTLTKPLGSLTGYLGMASGCGRNLQLTTAGYPQDKAAGMCMAAQCMQRSLDCDSPSNAHVCDTKMGMSGSPLFDGKNRVRLIHVAGVEGRQENRATTLTQFLVNTVNKW